MTQFIQSKSIDAITRLIGMEIQGLAISNQLEKDGPSVDAFSVYLLPNGSDAFHVTLECLDTPEGDDLEIISVQIIPKSAVDNTAVEIASDLGQAIHWGVLTDSSQLLDEIGSPPSKMRVYECGFEIYFKNGSRLQVGRSGRIDGCLRILHYPTKLETGGVAP